MRYVIFLDDKIKEEYFEKCEPSIYTARKSGCGCETPMVFSDKNFPEELTEIEKTEEEFLSHITADPNKFCVDESDEQFKKLKSDYKEDTP